MNKKGFTLVEVLAAVALIAILLVLTSTSFVKKYNESKRDAIIIQEEQLVQSGDMVVQDYCKDPLSEGYQLQCDNYYQSYEDSNNNLIIEDNSYTKYICVKDLKKLGYYSEELKYSGVDCSGVVIYKIDYDTDLQKDSYSVIKCGEDYVTEVENVNDYLTNFKECFETQNTGQPEEEKKYLLTVNFTELTPNGMKVGTSHSKEYKKGQSISVDVPEYKTFENEYTPFKHGSSQNDNNFSLNADRTKLTGTMPEGNVIINIVYSASTYVLTVNYKEFNDVQGNINFPSKQYTMYYGEEVEIPHENVANFKIISPNNFTYQMQQEDVEINVIYQQMDFNLTYNSNGGTACNSRKVTYNKAFGALCNPTRTGYTFDGWYLNGTPVTASTVNTNYNNVTLTAKWTANKYVVIYNCNGGTPTGSYSSEHTYDQVSNLLSNRCTKTGFVFTYWKDSEGKTYTNQNEIKNLRSENNDSITLTAQWEPLIYYIAFNANGGSGSMEKMTVTYGHVVNLKTNSFTRTGHRFDGWSGSDGKSYSNEASITNLTTVHGSTITMTARWIKCGAGTYLADNTCRSCPAGSYSTGGVNSCTSCSAGTYTSSAGSISCSTCAAGSYNTGTGNTSCRTCDVGYYCTGGAHKAACTAGKYSTGGASSCTICPAGSYCPGSSNKLACAAGTYTNGTGMSSCTTCAAGSYNTTTGNTSCTTCEAGYYCTGGTHKAYCVAGTYRTSTGGTSASSCSTCTAGYYCTGGTNRIMCPAGTYRTSTGGTSSSSCTTCPIGYSCTGGTNKTACDPGTYTSSTGKSSCTTCEAGYYCPGASNRIVCPTGHTSSSGASSCTKINYTVTISRNNTSYGSVNLSSVSVPYGTTYSVSGNKLTFSNGTTVTATPTAASGYTTTFSSWSSTSGTITGNVTITANFTRSASSVALLGSSGIGGSYYDCGSRNTSISVGSSSITVNYAGGNGSTSEFYWYGVNVTGYTKMSVYVYVEGLSDRGYATFYVGNKRFDAYEGGRTYTINISGSGNQRIGFDTYEVDYMSVSGWKLLP